MAIFEGFHAITEAKPSSLFSTLCKQVDLAMDNSLDLAMANGSIFINATSKQWHITFTLAVTSSFKDQ